MQSARSALPFVVSPELAKPLDKALEATRKGDLIAALIAFAECSNIEPNNKAVLYFASGVVQRAYFHLKHQDNPPPPEKLEKWREAAFVHGVLCAECAPTDAIAAHNVGRFIQDDGDDAAAVSWYRRALELDRALVESWGNLGTSLYSLGQIEEAERCWSKCVAFPARSPSASLAQAYVWLRRGDYARGWPALNHRWLDETFTSTYGRSDLKGVAWTGQPLRSRDRLLIHGEQGLGDHVMFARYVPALVERGVPIVGLETRAPLKRWMEASLPDVPVFVRDADELPYFTHHVPLMSLPGILGLQEPPAPLKPQIVDVPTRSDVGVKRVGIVWRGTTGNVADAERSIPVHELAALADVPGITWVPLQFDPSGDADAAACLWLGSNVEPVVERYTDVLGLAEVMLGLDLIVTVDTLALHVAGSVGVPTIALHRFNREWRWQQHREDCPWYPSVRHLTQPAPRDWAGLLANLRSYLALSR